MPEHIDQRVVLLVEDEPLVRMLGNEVLTEAGFRVIEAADATEALVLLEARPDILVVITDVELKGENGFSLRAPFGSDGPEWGSFYVRAGRSLVPAICRSMPYFWESAALVEQVKTMADCAAEPMIIVMQRPARRSRGRSTTWYRFDEVGSQGAGARHQPISATSHPGT